MVVGHGGENRRARLFRDQVKGEAYRMGEVAGMYKLASEAQEAFIAAGLLLPLEI